MKNTLKIYLRNLAKNHLFVFAFGFLALLLVAGTVIINIFWGGCFWLPLAKDNTTIKDYMTLYISMLGVIATLYASFVVIYAYDAWKEQKNFDTNLDLLKAADENLYHFKNYINKVCLRIIDIYYIYKNDKEYFIANTLYREKKEDENKHLEDFNMYIERYLDYNNDESLKNLLNDYYELANQVIDFNDDFIENIYKPIYNSLSPYSSENKWNNTFINPSRIDNNNNNKINTYYEYLLNRYEGAGIVKSEYHFVNKSYEFVSYQKLYDLMNENYIKLNKDIKKKMRA
ncbi:hypothetical protein [Acinetobacter baumannii]|uniref:hypothetical protein n=1 Tax=Acinetobacter baumannii TaxID=470 RepID=UPI003878273C